MVPKPALLISAGVHVVPQSAALLPTTTVPLLQLDVLGGATPAATVPVFVNFTPGPDMFSFDPVVLTVTVTPLIVAFAGILNPKFVSRSSLL